MNKINDLWKKLISKLPTLAFDVLAIPVAWYLAYWLRYNMHPFPKSVFSVDSLNAIAILIVMQVGCYYYFKVYRGLWRFSSLGDVTRIIQAVVAAVVLSIPLFYLFSILHYIPRSVLPLYAINLVAILSGARVLMRQYWQKRSHHEEEFAVRRVLIVGAGQAGESLIRDLKRSRLYQPVGLVDDNVSKRGLEVHGVRVVASTRELPEAVEHTKADLIFIAIPTARSAVMRRIVSHCERSGVSFRTLPSIQAIASGQVEVNALRAVNIEDLLGRDQVELNWDKISASITQRKVLVTGGGGSIGSELCRQILQLNPAKLLILDNSEFNLYSIELELKERFPHIPIELALVSVTDVVAVESTVSQFKPDIVFHAASYKHVPMLEDQIRIAVQNNVIGTQVVAQASVQAEVKKFILISTDKAVNPSNIMGTTKRVAEIYCQNLNERTNTQFITVRFGNVLGSVGSVVPLFKNQLQKGGPLTVTHPDIQRYFMTISEACQLILQAMVNGWGGEIFVLDMGEPVKITYLAEQMIRLAGKEPNKDIHIKYTGLRPGEKLFEELFHSSELLEQTAHEKLFQAKFRKINWNELTESMQMLKGACDANQNDELFVLLKSLVPEFHQEATASSLC